MPMTPIEHNHKTYRILLRMVVCFLLVVAVGACKHKPAEDPYAHLAEEIRSVNKLALVEAQISKVVILQDPDIHLSDVSSLQGAVAWLKNKIKTGTRTAIFSFDATMSGYIDLSTLAEADVQVDKKGKTATLVLPPVQLQLLGRDFTMDLKYQRVTGYRDQVSAAERAKLKERAYAKLEQEVNKNSALRQDLMRKAQTKAVGWFTQLFAMKGLSVSVRFRDDAATSQPVTVVPDNKEERHGQK